ncbi:AAA family ATPase [Maioricimonas rarisocia]|uniref:AAA family ATPase n=1 Tax=Maioricimonas rarisocia TaxID=2528026 RepID=UPI0011A550B3|nr:AAA family ATPase [Maioricimonas rarisocia]
MTVQNHLLIVGDDSGLPEELETALSSDAPGRIVVHVARDLTNAVDLARSLFPPLAVVDMPGEMETFKATLQEIQAVSPETVIAGAYRPDVFSSQTWEQAPQGAIFVEGLRFGARDFLRRPVSSADLRQLLDRTLTTAARVPATRGVTVAFISNKGGVGKSTLAVNAATRLAQQHPGEVLLIDASLQMGVCAPMLDLHPETTLVDAIRERERLDTTLVRQLTTPHPCGLDLLAAPPDAVAATEIGHTLLTRILNLARRTYNYVLVDTFPLLDSIVMAVLDASDMTYIVLDNVVPTMLSVTQLLSLLDGLGHPAAQRRTAVNRMTKAAGNPTRTDIEATLQQPVDHLFPYDRRALTAANLGRPFALNPRRWSALERGLRGLVGEIEHFREQAVLSNGRGDRSAAVPSEDGRFTRESTDD